MEILFFFSFLRLANDVGFDQCCRCFPHRFEERFLPFLCTDFVAMVLSCGYKTYGVFVA